MKKETELDLAMKTIHVVLYEVVRKSVKKAFAKTDKFHYIEEFNVAHDGGADKYIGLTVSARLTGIKDPKEGQVTGSIQLRKSESTDSWFESKIHGYLHIGRRLCEIDVDRGEDVIRRLEPDFHH